MNSIKNNLIDMKIDHLISKALEEDAHDMDITTNYLIPKESISEGFIVSKENSILCGIEIAKRLFQKLDPEIKFQAFFSDGDSLKKDNKIVHIKGKTRAILTGERTALNFLCYLSGISSNTNHFVKAVRPYKSQILGTRKTTPCLRKLEKYAVKCGGGINHRHNLKEMIMIKDNHRNIYHGKISLTDAILKFQKTHSEKIIVEVDTLAQFKEALNAQPNIILLDNMNLQQLRKAVKINKKLPSSKQSLLEASGGITLRNVRNIAKTGVDRISIGSLTHTHKAINMSLEVIN